MEINWSINGTNYNFCLKGTCPRKINTTYLDVAEFISKKYSVYLPFISCAKEGKKVNLNDLIEDNLNYLIFDFTIDIELFGLGKFSNFDSYNHYQLITFKMYIYRRNENVNKDLHSLDHWKNTEKVQINCIAKVIKETEKNYIIKLPKPYHINWGRGPILPSYYALLQKEPKYIFPIELYNRFEEVVVKFVKEFDNEFNGFEFPWCSSQKDKCCICLENTSNVYGYCDETHLVSCENCISKITKCPICYSKIICHNTVSFV